MLMAGLAGGACGCWCYGGQRWKDFSFLFRYLTINEEDCVKRKKEKNHLRCFWHSRTQHLDASGWKMHKTIDTVM